MNATAALGDARSGLPTRALEAEAAQYAFQLGYTRPDALEVVTGERDEPVGVRATTVAVRCPLSKSPISPNVLPGPRICASPPSVRTSTSLFDDQRPATNPNITFGSAWTAASAPACAGEPVRSSIKAGGQAG